MNKGKILIMSLLGFLLIFGMVLASCDNGQLPKEYEKANATDADIAEIGDDGPLGFVLDAWGGGGDDDDDDDDDNDEGGEW